MARNGGQMATCPLCREPIEIAEVIDEPKVGIYQRVEMSNEMGTAMETGAGTVTLDMLARGTGDGNQWGTHLAVTDAPLISMEDEYGNVAQVRHME